MAERDGKRCNCLAVLTCAMDTTTFQSELIEMPLSSKYQKAKDTSSDLNICGQMLCYNKSSLFDLVVAATIAIS